MTDYDQSLLDAKEGRVYEAKDVDNYILLGVFIRIFYFI